MREPKEQIAFEADLLARDDVSLHAPVKGEIGYVSQRPMWIALRIEGEGTWIYALPEEAARG